MDSHHDQLGLTVRGHLQNLSPWPAAQEYRFGLAVCSRILRHCLLEELTRVFFVLAVEGSEADVFFPDPDLANELPLVPHAAANIDGPVPTFRRQSILLLLIRKSVSGDLAA